MSAARPLARLAVRDARHHPWRSALIVLLIALPVAGFVFATIGMRTVPDTGAELRAETMGSADALVHPPERRASAVAARLRAAGFHVTPWTQGEGVVRAGGSRGARMTAGLESIDLTDPLSRGIWDLRSGRVPARPGEVLLSTAAATRLRVRVGDRVTLEQGRRSLLVTGIALPPELSARQVIGPDLLDGLATANQSPPELLVGGLGPGAAGQEVLAQIVATSEVLPASLFDDAGTGGIEADAQVLLYMLGTLGLMAFGLVVASAMAVGARRQLRVLGLLGAAGASPRQRSGSMLLQGVALGAAGTVIGLAGGLAAWALARDTIEERYAERIGATVVDTGDLVLIAVVALAVSVGASLLPARVASRTSVLQALGGRRPTPRVPVRMPVAGVAVSAIGLLMLADGLDHRPNSGIPLVATAGVALAVIGTTITVPYLVGLLERAAGGLRGTGRLAVRDVARHRGRTGPVVAAVMATGALALAGGVLARSAEADRHTTRYTDPRTVILTVSGQAAASIPGCDRLAVLAAPVAKILPGAATACMRQVSDEATTPFRTVRPGDLAALGLAAHRRDLEAGRVLWITFPDGVSPPQPLEVSTPDGPVRPQVVPVRVSVGLAGFAGGGFLADADLVRRWLPRSLATDTSLVLRLPAPITDAQRAALTRMQDDLGLRLDGRATMYASLLFDTNGGFSMGRVIYWVILPVALVLSVLVVLVGLALVASDGRDERTTLVAVGAGPGHRRRMQAVRAFVLAGMGQALALPVGVACAWVVLRSLDVAFVTPWPLVAALLVGLPVAAAAMGAALIRRDVPAVQRRGT